MSHVEEKWEKKRKKKTALPSGGAPAAFAEASTTAGRGELDLRQLRATLNMRGSVGRRLPTAPIGCLRHPQGASGTHLGALW